MVRQTWLLLLLALPFRSASAVVLYDASLGSQPDDQHWIYLASGVVTRQLAGGEARLDTTEDLTTLAGYFSSVPLLGAHPDIPTLDLAASDWVLRFTLRIASGTDTPDSDPLATGQRNRGAFSLIAIANDGRGVELVFQPDNVLVLDDSSTAFPLGESATFDSTAGFRTYELLLQDGGYTLLTDNASSARQPILNGGLRNYGPVAPAGLLSFVYTTPNFIFFGDDTPRGAGDVRLGLLEAIAVPEPSACFLTIVGALVAMSYQRSAKTGRPPSAPLAANRRGDVA